jgi:hypothetical protein
MNDLKTETFEYTIYTSNAPTGYYCKVVEFSARGSVTYNVAVGGPDTFCFLISMKPSNGYIPYIDRVEYNDGCALDGNLSSIEDLTKAALHATLFLFPHIQHFTLMDDSHIDCIRGDKRYRLNLAYDSVLKRNQTWYENRFGAVLPGSVSEPDTLLGRYKDSLKVLDEPAEHFEIIVRSLPYIGKYKEQYVASESPRDFINKLRTVYADKYCIEVEKWLPGYMEYLTVAIFKSEWIIPANAVNAPSGFRLELVSPETKRGGGRKRRLVTRRNSKARKGRSVGTFGEFEY